MGLACSNIRLLTLTSRKADCEYNISIDSMEKMAVTREQSELSKQYYSKLKNKDIAYYADSKYNKMTYQYLMGYSKFQENIGSTFTNKSYSSQQRPVKKDNNMILTDYNGLVVMNSYYKQKLIQVLGPNCIDSAGRGGTFDTNEIPALIAACCTQYNEEKIRNAMNGDYTVVQSNYSNTNNLSRNITSTTNKDVVLDNVQNAIDFYYPIFAAAATNGWTSEYNMEMERNDDYVSDALCSGTFQLAEVNEQGNYEPDTSLSYFCLSGLVIDRQDSDKREEITAWYNAEKERITEKENWLDMEISDLSTELEAINTEMESVKSFIDDNIQKVFSWGSS